MKTILAVGLAALLSGRYPEALFKDDWETAKTGWEKLHPDQPKLSMKEWQMMYRMNLLPGQPSGPGKAEAAVNAINAGIMAGATSSVLQTGNKSRRQK